MKARRAVQWAAFFVGAIGALLTCYGALSIAFALLPGLSGQWGGSPFLMAALFSVLVAVGIGALFGVTTAYRMLKRGRWAVMVLVLALAASPVPLTFTAAKIVGPLPYDDQGRLIYDEAK